MSISKKTLFCWFLLYGCVTACAADELAPGEPQEEKKVEKLRVSLDRKQSASCVAVRRKSAFFPLSPPSKQIPIPRRLSLSCLTLLDEPSSKSGKWLRLREAQLRKMYINPFPYKNMGVIELFPIALCDPTIGHIAYFVKSENIERSQSDIYASGKILFVPLGIADDKICWMAIPDQRSTMDGKPYLATMWFSKRALPPIKFVSDGAGSGAGSDDDEPDERLINLNNLLLHNFGEERELYFSAEEIKKMFA